MRIFRNENDLLTIDDDENVMEKVKEFDLDTIEINGRITAARLAEAYDVASRRHDVISCAEYAKLKEEYLRIFG